MNRKLDKAITRTPEGLMGYHELNKTEALFAVSEMAGIERKLRIAAKAVLKASEGTDEIAMYEALEQLRKALK